MSNRNLIGLNRICQFVLMFEEFVGGTRMKLDFSVTSLLSLLVTV